MRKPVLVIALAALVELADGFTMSSHPGFGGAGAGLRALRTTNSAVRPSGVPLLAKKKKGKSKGSASTGSALSEPKVELDADPALMPGGLADSPMMPDGAEMPMPSKKTDEVQALIRDRSLESQFVEIPKGAIVVDPQERAKKQEELKEDEDAAFGLPGWVLRALKNGTWACIGLLVFAEVVARTPLIDQFKEGANQAEQAALQERRELDKAGKSLPGIRPWEPVGGLNN